MLLLMAGCGAPEPADEAAEPPETASAAAEAPSPAPAPAQPEGPYAPRDECGRLAGAGDFRARLIEAVRLRDADAVVELADPGVKLDFGGGGGHAELRERLAAGPELWQALDELLHLGCAVNAQGGLTMPWLFAQDIGEFDPYATMLVMGEDVKITNHPSADDPPLDIVSWDMVEVVSYDPAAPFTAIRVADGGTGFIATDKLRAVIDYRLLADRIDGRWKVTALVAGD